MSDAPPICPSCGSADIARFCAHCGERAVHELRIGHLLHEFLHELFHVDGKLPSTLRLLFTMPGALATDYVAGRRVPHLNPLRLYLLVFVLHASLGALLLSHHELLPERAASSVDPAGWIRAAIASRPEVDWHAPQLQDRLARTGHWLAEGGTLLIFLGVAGVQALVLRRFRRGYAEHAVLSVSVFTFYLILVTLLQLPLERWGDSPPAATLAVAGGALVGAAFLVYWYLAIRRFYGAPVLGSLLSTAVIALASVLIASAMNLAVLAILVRLA